MHPLIVMLIGQVGAYLVPQLSARYDELAVDVSPLTKPEIR